VSGLGETDDPPQAGSASSDKDYRSEFELGQMQRIVSADLDRAIQKLPQKGEKT
jgi:hypothetical protein